MSVAADHEDPVGELRRWILSAHPGVDSIHPTDDLIEQRLVDSLRFVRFIIELERLSGRGIDVATLDLDSVRTLAAIQRTFF